MYKRHSFSISLCLIILLPFFVIAQTNPVVNVGNIKSLQVGKQGISFKTDHAFGEITVYNPNIIRVRLDKKPLGRNFSYAVITQPQITKIAITQNDDGIILITDSLKMVIQRNPFAITYYIKWECH